MVGKIPPVVSCSWLKQYLGSVGKNFKLLDASWTLKQHGKPAYLSKHIPGALFFDQARCVTPIQTIVHNLPDPDCHQRHLRSLGVSTDSHLVVYARGDILSGARAWWTIRAMGHQNVSVLDGGIEQWELEGGETETGMETYEGPEGNLEVKINSKIMKKFEEMAEMAKKGGEQLIDTRVKDNFLGVLPEPSDNTVTALKSANFPLPKTMNGGHVPGALNVHVSLFKAQPGKLKTKDELSQVFKDSGIDLQRPLTIMCYNGLNACVPALAAAWLGKDDAAVYYGSWTEYGQRADPSLCKK